MVGCEAFAAKRAGDSHLPVLRANLCRWKRLETPGLWTRIAAFGIAVGRHEAARSTPILVSRRPRLKLTFDFG
jgi:hypothetical protein